MKQLQETLKKHRKSLLKYPNVVMVGIGNKIKDGKDTGELAVIVGVSKKLSLSALLFYPNAVRNEYYNGKVIVPKMVGTQKTDVQEVGVIKVLEQVGRVRPAIPGYSVGHYAITAGTIGLKVYDAVTGEPLLLSNNHVLADCDRGQVGDPILQPGPYDGGIAGGDTIAHLLRWINLTTGTNCFSRLWSKIRQVNPVVDCAVGSLTSPDILVDEISGLVKPTSIMEATVGMACQKSGRTTGVTQGTVQAIDVTVQVDYGDLGLLTFEDQLALTVHSEGGDSGSAILSGDTVVGLLFAGSDTVTIANRIQNVFDALGIKLASELVPTPSQILVKVSSDGGGSWTDYAPGATPAQS